MSHTSRRVLGAVIGLLTGLLYGVISQTINQIALPGIPFYQEGLGTLATILLTAFGGGVLGLLAAWPEESIQGVITGALVAAAISTLGTVINVRASTVAAERLVGVYAVLFITFLPRAFVYAPVAWLIRRAVGIWENEVVRETLSFRKMALSLVPLLILAVVFGALELYPKDARYALKTTDELVQAGMKANGADELPSTLRKVDGFLQQAQGPYTLLLGDDPDVLPVQRPMTSYTVQEYAVFVNFENGFRFGCAYTPPHPEPSCGNY
jgi:hypothetical protein